MGTGVTETPVVGMMAGRGRSCGLVFFRRPGTLLAEVDLGTKALGESPFSECPELSPTLLS